MASKQWYAEVRGFDRFRSFYVWAEDEEEARDKALAECHIGVTVKPGVVIAEQILKAQSEQ